MNLLRTLKVVAFLAVSSVAFNSCIQAPDYPETPKIEENAITVFRKDDFLGLRDSVEIALNFEDGDGDLGLNSADTLGVYARNGGTNRFYNNYFVQVFYKDPTSGNFVPLPPTPGFSYDGRFMRLTEADTRSGPLKGVLRYALPFELDFPPTLPGAELQFRVSIVDRALHESNVITTSTVVL